MDNIQQLKLSNQVSMMVMKHDFPINGKAVITIEFKNNQPTSLDVKNVKSKKEG